MTPELVVKKHGGYIKSHALRNKAIVENPVLGLDLDDLIQEYNVAVITGIDKYDPERGAVTTFISTICDSVNRVLLRKSEKASKTFDYISIDGISTEEPHYETPLAVIEIQERIAECAGKLSRYAKEYAYLVYGNCELVDREMKKAQAFDKLSGTKRKVSTDRSTMAVAIMRKKYTRTDGTCIAAIDDVVTEFKGVFSDTF